MLKQFFTLIPFFSLTIILVGCSGNENTENSNEQSSESANQQTTPKISLVEVVSPKFPDALLEMTEPLEGTEYDAGSISFEFNVTNYQLGTQTLDADTKQCANSGNGQHIHLIVNGAPYLALYEPSHQMELEAGNYVTLAFLSRSYHESLKHYGSYVIRQFSVGETEEKPVDLSAPHMFYSRPKAAYKGVDTEKIILDFYLINTALSSDGNKVRATINGEQFLIDKWVPYFIEGLPMGDSSIKLELLDSTGNPIPGPFNTVERTISLTPDDAT